MEAVAFPYFGGAATNGFVATDHPDIVTRNVPVRILALKDGATPVATVFDLLCANYGLDRGLGGGGVGVGLRPGRAVHAGLGRTRDRRATRTHHPCRARIRAATPRRPNGRSMVILGAGVNHWYHMDMTYRGIINLLVLCGCVGQSGGGWSHYVGQEKLRPQTGWVPVAFGLDWSRPPRHMNGTSFFYAHTDQWRYETLKVSEILSPTAPDGDWCGIADRLQRARGAHGLAAVGAAAQAEPADDCRTRNGRGPGTEGLRGQGPAVRRT